MREYAYTTRQLHYQLHYDPFCGKDSASVASIHQRYEPMTDKFAAA